MSKNWRQVPRRGSVVEDASIISLAAGPDPGCRPTKLILDGRPVVHYSRPRLYLDRNAWESLPPEGILALRVRQKQQPHLTLAMTRLELEATFGEVRQTESWKRYRCYHFPKLPPAVDAYRVGADAVEPARRLVNLSPDLNRREWAQALAQTAGLPAESTEYLERVQYWRALYRPKQVRILLLAESHAAEMPGDRKITVNNAGFVRSLYCPGYGESTACSSLPVSNSGTPIWMLFSEIALVLAGLPRYRGTDPAERLKYKRDILNVLQGAGIWLEDACVAGIYASGSGRRFRGAFYRETLRESYQNFVWPGVAGEPLAQVWTLGRATVAPALSGLPGIDLKRVLPMPGWRVEAFRGVAKKAAKSMLEALQTRSYVAGAS